MGAISAFFNGRWIPASELRISVDDAGFLFGATVTERMRTFQGQVFRLNAHLARLQHSLKIVGLDDERISSQIADVVPELIQRNRSSIDTGDDWSIIAFVTPGIAGEASPTVCVHGNPLPFLSWASHYETGLPVVVSHVRQIPPNCVPPELKCRSRMHFYLADREAASKQPGARAILLDQEGFIAEATTANVVVYRKAVGLISPRHEHVLFGISLGVVQELAAQIDVPFIARSLSVEEFCSADEAMLASTSICTLPIIECDGRAIGDGKPGPIYRKLLAAWSEMVGLDIADQARRYSNRRAQ